MTPQPATRIRRVKARGQPSDRACAQNRFFDKNGLWQKMSTVSSMRYRFLHNQIDLILSAALRSRNDVIVARVRLPLESLAEEYESVDSSPSDVVTARRQGGGIQ